MSKFIEQKVLKGRYSNDHKYMKKCSLSLAKKDMQIKTTLTFHLTQVRMARRKKNNNNNKSLRGCRKTNPYTLLMGR
jgi:hypothetical protein